MTANNPCIADTAKHPGVCYACGQRIYTGDQICICSVAGNTVAVHVECWDDKEL